MKETSFFFLFIWRIMVCLLAIGWLKFTVLRMAFWCWVSKPITAHIATLCNKTANRSVYLMHRIALMEELKNTK